MRHLVSKATFSHKAPVVPDGTTEPNGCHFTDENSRRLSLWQICSHWWRLNLLRCRQRWQICHYDITFFSIYREYNTVSRISLSHRLFKHGSSPLKKTCVLKTTNIIFRTCDINKNCILPICKWNRQEGWNNYHNWFSIGYSSFDLLGFLIGYYNRSILCTTTTCFC